MLKLRKVDSYVGEKLAIKRLKRERNLIKNIKILKKEIQEKLLHKEH